MKPVKRLWFLIVIVLFCLGFVVLLFPATAYWILTGDKLLDKWDDLLSTWTEDARV